MAYLDAATVTDILRNRPVWIATEKEYDEFSPKFEILAVHFSLDDAMLKVLQKALCEAKAFSRFDPHDRWHRTKPLSWNSPAEQIERNDCTCVNYLWHDYWSRFICLPKYHIEEWQPDKGLVERSVFSFESWFKHKIASERPSCTLVKNWLTDWSTSVTSGHIPAELRQRVVPEAEDFGQDLAGDKDEWVSVYGSPGSFLEFDKIPAQPAYA